MSSKPTLSPDGLADFLPLAERALTVVDDGFIRLRSGQGKVAGFVTLPYSVIAGRTLPSADPDLRYDITFATRDFARWLADGDVQPARRDAHWLTALPPTSGWQRLDRVPEPTVRELVRSGAELAQGANGRAEQDSLLSSAVLSASAGAVSVDVPLRALAALTRMQFLPRDSEAAVDAAPGWVRLAALYGSTFVATDSNPLFLGLL